MSGDRHHSIQASLLGGFGRTPAGKKQRDADIELRRTGSATTETTTPDQVGWIDKLYRLQNPGPGGDPDEVDKLWDPVENGYRAAVGHLENRSVSAADIDWLIQYCGLLSCWCVRVGLVAFCVSGGSGRAAAVGAGCPGAAGDAGGWCCSRAGQRLAS